MKTYVQEGKILSLVTPSGGWVSGQLVVVGVIAGVAQLTTLEGETNSVCVSGVVTIPKATGAALTVGARVYSNAGAAVTTTNTHTPVGVVVTAAASDATTVEVLLAY